jgi:uncharacterized lipoprotein YmbA
MARAPAACVAALLPAGSAIARLLAAGCAAAPLLAGCATAPDHFYTLNTLPEAGDRMAPAPTTLHARLNVTIPSIVDRSEMVLTTSRSGISIPDHERWAAPLSDQVSNTLARDIERRRADLLIGDGRFDQASSPPATIKVDIVRMTAERGGEARIDAHWRIVYASAGVDSLGGGSFASPVNGQGYAAVAQAYSEVLRELAEALAIDVPRR